MTEKKLKQLIDRYLQGTATREEKDLLDELYTRNINSEEVPEKWNDQQKSSVKKRILSRIQQDIQLKKEKRTRKIFSAVAAVLILLVSSYIYFNSSPTKVLSGSDIVMEISTTATSGEQSILLSDGSFVLLSQGASLTYPEEFSGNTRKVYLKGAAWFDINRDTTQAFQVITEDITTTVLGTSFSINAQLEKSKVDIRVTSGKVQVASQEKEIAVLDENDELQYESGQFTVIKDSPKKDNTEKLPEAGSWKFTNVTMEEATNFLKKHWNKQFFYENPAIRDCQIYASFNSDDSLEEVMLILCGVTNSAYQVNGKRILISGPGCLLTQ